MGKQQQFNIDYNTCYKRNFKLDVKGAVKLYLDSDNTPIEDGSAFGLILYPQALNPFLKIMESLNESKNIVILPAFDTDDGVNKPAYLIIKVFGETDFVTKIVTENK
jgi:hypothetical protein